MTDIVKLARGYVFDDVQRTHYNGCEAEHVSCLMGMLADEIERLRDCISAREVRSLVDERDRLRAERDAAELMSLALKVDAERYLWIFSNCDVTYYKHDFPFDSEADLDAAMKEERK